MAVPTNASIVEHFQALEDPRIEWTKKHNLLNILVIASLRIIAAITQAEVIRKMLRHLKLAADPPPLAPARARQATFDGVA
jgi:hypothetical protein